MTGEDTPVQALPILFVFVEDGTLFIAEDLAAVRRECEPIDVESGVYTFYDGAGRPPVLKCDIPIEQKTRPGVSGKIRIEARDWR